MRIPPLKNIILSNRKTLVLTLVSILVICYGVFLFASIRSKLKQAKEELNRVNRMIQEVYSSLQDSKNMAQGLVQMQDEAKRLHNLLPSSDDLNDLIRLFSSEAQERKVRVVSVTPQSPLPLVSFNGISIESEHISYFAIPIQIRLQGRYHEIGDFLLSLNSFPRFITLQKMSLKRDKNIEPLVSAECEFATYYLVEKQKNGS